MSPNFHYIAGRRREYQVKRDLERAGHYVLRSAGSRGHFDLVAINLENGKVTLVQCKNLQDKAAAKRIMAAFEKNPPLPKSDKYTQLMNVYVTKGREKFEVEI